MEEALSQAVAETSAPVSNEQSSAPQEKMISQSQANALIGKARQEGAARAVEEFKRSQAESAPSQQTHRDAPLQVDESRFRQMAAEEAQRLRDEWFAQAQQKHDEETAQNIVKGFYDKIDAGKQKYDDFEAVTGDIDLRVFPNAVQILSQHIDNPHDLLYEFGRNATKLDQIERLAERSPKMAIAEAKRLAESMKKNDYVSTRRDAHAPLNQQRSSNVGTDSGSILSMRDLKAKYRV